MTGDVTARTTNSPYSEKSFKTSIFPQIFKQIPAFCVRGLPSTVFNNAATRPCSELDVPVSHRKVLFPQDQF